LKWVIKCNLYTKFYVDVLSVIIYLLGMDNDIMTFIS